MSNECRIVRTVEESEENGVWTIIVRTLDSIRRFTANAPYETCKSAEWLREYPREKPDNAAIYAARVEEAKIQVNKARAALTSAEIGLAKALKEQSICEDLTPNYGWEHNVKMEEIHVW